MRIDVLTGLFQRWTLRLHLYAEAVRRLLRSRGRAADEIEAFSPFDSRIRFQHVVITGKDGFLFHQDHDALDQLSGKLAFRPRQTGVWTGAMRARQAWCDAHGAQMRMMIVPEKHLVYRDKMPAYVKISDGRPVRQLMAAVRRGTGHDILYPLDALRQARARRPVFLKTDTHWTSFGAFVAYRALADSLEDSFALEKLEESELVFKTRPFTGDLGVRFRRERSETIEIAEPPVSYGLTFQNHNFGRGAVHVYESERRDLPRCVLFRDSFSNAMIPFLMRGFSRLVAVSSMSCHYDLLEQERPDVVLFAAIERFVATFGTGHTIELPQDDAAMSFADFSGTPLAELMPQARD